jgi:hypothetical protein
MKNAMARRHECQIPVAPQHLRDEIAQTVLSAAKFTELIED